MVNGSGSCLISGELSGSRLTRFELGGSMRAALHSAHLRLILPWGYPTQFMQWLFTLP